VFEFAVDGDTKGMEHPGGKFHERPDLGTKKTTKKATAKCKGKRSRMIQMSTTGVCKIKSGKTPLKLTYQQ